MKKTHVLSCTQVSKIVPAQGLKAEVRILEDINLKVEQGEALAIVGTSGCGKTTLLSLLAGLDLSTHGSIRLFDHQLGELSEDTRAELRGRYIGFVFQSFHLMENFTALENVMLPLEINQVPEAAELARELLERVGMSHRADYYPTTLSGGEQQRIAIARAFVVRPQLLLADEPTGNLDMNTSRQVIDLLFELNRTEGVSLVLVTHDEQLSRSCNRRLRLVQGSLEAE